MARFPFVPSDRHFRDNVATLASGAAIAQLVSLAAYPLLTRLYSPSEFGRFGLFLSFGAVVSVVSSLGFETAIVRAGDRTEAAALFHLAIYLAGVACVLGALGLYGLVQLDWLGYGSLGANSAVILAVFVAVAALFSTFRYWLVRLNSFAEIRQATVLQNVGRAAAQALLGFSGWSWIGIVGGEIFGRSISTGRMAFAARLRDAAIWGSVGRQQVLAAARANHRFALYFTPSNLLDLVAIVSAIPLIATFYSVEAGGHFALMQRLATLPIVILGATVADAFYTRAVHLRRDSPAALRGFFQETAFALALYAAVPIIAISLSGPLIATWLFGDDWRTLGDLAAIMAPWTGFLVVITPLSRLVLVLDRQRSKLTYDAVALVTTLGSVWVGQFAGLSFLQMVAVLTATQTAALALYFTILYRLASASSQHSPT